MQIKPLLVLRNLVVERFQVTKSVTDIVCPCFSRGSINPISAAHTLKIDLSACPLPTEEPGVPPCEPTRLHLTPGLRRVSLVDCFDSKPRSAAVSRTSPHETTRPHERLVTMTEQINIQSSQ